VVVRVKPCLVEVEVSSDDRGCFIPFSHAVARDLSAHAPVPKRAYVVYNYGRGVIRGFHFHAREWKYFFVAGGAAKFVAIDPEDPRDRHVFVASIRRPGVVIVPPGYANGWVSLEDQTTVVCLSSATFEESLADDTRYDPLTWGDVWSVRAR
jgi:dTDP-4-dehydrorhamnose 3,5-epimerase-like enzyme